jgi:hypothetical protein
MPSQFLVFANSAQGTTPLVSLRQTLCIINLPNAGVKETDLILDSLLAGIWVVDRAFSGSLNWRNK